MSEEKKHKHLWQYLHRSTFNDIEWCIICGAIRLTGHVTGKCKILKPSG